MNHKNSTGEGEESVLETSTMKIMRKKETTFRTVSQNVEFPSVQNDSRGQPIGG